jgi:pSer/pThr/pTyr-binding forkhead associated (FHA) protein
MMMVDDVLKPRPEDDNHQVTFLIVDGSRVVSIDQPVINIGRKSDNQIVIDNEHVSRYHAQIRRIKERYVILDLNSTVGTSVNGEKIDQVALRPGDVISLGGVPIIFGQGSLKAEFENLGSEAYEAGDSGPTENTEINHADRYLDLFNTPDNGKPLESNE